MLSSTRYFMHRMGIGLAALACWACLLTAAQAQVPARPQPLRVALVVGNDAYAGAPLANAVNDGRAVADSLRRLGFEVIQVTNGTRLQLEAGIQRLSSTLAGNKGIGLFYYAGHAVQIEWRNFLVPVDAALRTARDIPVQTVDVSTVLAAFANAGTRMNIVVLDACRDNPFGSTGRVVGLAQMDAPPRTFIAYSTAPGNVAEDGIEGGHSLYTHFLLKELAQPRARVEDVFKRVRLNVRQRTLGRQIPWESTSLEDEFYFDGLITPVSTGAKDDAQRSKVESGFARELSDWKRVADSTRPEDVYAFLKKYPNGALSEVAQFRLDQLQRPGVRAQQDKSAVPVFPSGVNRYERGDFIEYERINELTHERKRLPMRVTRADRKRVEFNGGAVVYDQMGNILRNRFGTKVPGALIAPADIAVGKRWHSAYVNTAPNGKSMTTHWDNDVSALETIELPAGRFVAYRVEKAGWSRHADGSSTHLSATIWIDPRTMIAIRADQVFWYQGKIVEKSSDRLTQLKQVPRRSGR